ncbi:MAG: UvrD-helicase domain-containing protein, partial [Treponema sp.]|nr:UvrD-helicase domain-containing protein [Treponema sp.]
MESDNQKAVLNGEQRRAAFCAKNAVIAAGAGSGKTMVLASRYAWLVTEKKYRVREILTLTFTKKAAAQMYRRIYLELAEIAGKDQGEKGKLASAALGEFAQARIQTLDSYSASIVRQAANRYGISPDFTIDEDRCMRLAVDEAMPFLIGSRNHPAIQRLYPGKSPVSIARDLFAPALFHFACINKPPGPAGSPPVGFGSQCAAVRGEWERQCALFGGKLEELSGAYSGNERLLPGLAPLIEIYDGGGVIFPPAEELGGFFSLLAAKRHTEAVEWADSHPLQKKMAFILDYLSSLTALDMRRGTRGENPVKELLNWFRGAFGEFSSLAVFCMQAGLVYSVLSLLEDLQRGFLDKKRAERIMTFNDAARLAKAILIEQPDIRRSEKETFRAIMIDEFQDNNELQKDLLFLLAEKAGKENAFVPAAEDLCPDKLFFVGDEKQSVYRFRGADVSVFRRLKSELGSEDLPLTGNYRSAPGLIGAFNEIFGGTRPVFGKAGGESGLPLYEAEYTPLRAMKSGRGKLTLCVLDKQETGAGEEAGGFEAEDSGLLLPVENEARFTAERIKKLLNEKNGEGGPKYRPDEIAVLFRSRTNQHFFEKHLMLLSIPYACEDLNGFFQGGPVDDLMSVLRLAAYPADRAAYAQMLRSPFAGLSLPGLAACIAVLDSAAADAAVADGEESPAPFGDEALPLLGESDREKYLNGRLVYQKITGRARTESISSLLSELWYGEGYRYETEWNPKTASYGELYDYLFHLAAGADEENLSLSEFADSVQRLGFSEERLSDIEIPLESRAEREGGAVRLMTVHKSKGLEFPVVFLCCCDKKGRNSYPDDIFDSGGFGLTLNPPLPPACKNTANVRRGYFWERSSAEEKKMETAELRRLLYVAMTRAEKELYLTGCLGISKKLPPEASSGNFSQNLKRYIEIKNGDTGGAIPEGSTFFDLCLPAIGASIPPEGFEAGGSGAGDPLFAVEEIPAYSERYIKEAEQSGSRFPNDQNGLNAFFDLAEPFYKNVNAITTPDVQRKHFSPVFLASLAGKGGNNGEGDILPDSACSGAGSAGAFKKADALIGRYAKYKTGENEKFDQAGFGTIAHACVEALLTGKEARIPQEFSGFLSPADSSVFLEAGKELALCFAHSPLGIMARNSENRKNEFPFRSLLCDENGNEIFINGT